MDRETRVGIRHSPAEKIDLSLHFGKLRKRSASRVRRRSNDREAHDSDVPPVQPTIRTDCLTRGERKGPDAWGELGEFFAISGEQTAKIRAARNGRASKLRAARLSRGHAGRHPCGQCFLIELRRYSEIRSPEQRRTS